MLDIDITLCLIFYLMLEKGFLLISRADDLPWSGVGSLYYDNNIDNANDNYDNNNDDSNNHTLYYYDVFYKTKR